MEDRAFGELITGLVVVGDDDLHPQRSSSATSETEVIPQSTVINSEVPRCASLSTLAALSP